MTHDMRSQIKELTSYIEDTQTPVDGSTIRSSPATSLPGRRSAHPIAWIAAVAAIAVVVLVALPLALRSPTPEAPTDSQPVTTTLNAAPTTVPPDTTPSAVSTTTAPRTTPAPLVEWQTLSFEPGSGPMHGQVGSGDDRLLILQPGYEGWEHGVGLTDPDGDPRTLLWVSQDGQMWTATHLERFDASRPNFLGEVAGWVLISDWDEESSEYHTWGSRDLDEWVALPTEFIPGRYVATDSTIIAISNGSVVTSFTHELQTLAVNAEPFPAVDDPFVIDVAATDDSFFALVYPNGSGMTQLWESNDGIAWSRVELGLPSGIEQLEPRIVANSQTVIVFNDREGPNGPWWVSHDGVPFENLRGPRAAGEVRLAATDFGFYLSQTAGIGEGSIATMGGHTTADGSEWVETPGPVSLDGGIAVAGNVILVRTGSWIIERNADGTVAGESWESDGGYLLGTMTPLG